MPELTFQKAVLAGKLRAELVASLGDADSGGKIYGVRTGAIPCMVDVTDAMTGEDETTIAGLVTAHDPTPPATPIQTYADAFLTKKKAIANVGMVFSEAFRQSTGTIGEFRSAIANTLTAINALGGGFVTEFDHERTAYYLTRYGAIPADDMAGTTLLQCQTYYDFLAPWIARLMGMLGAALARNLDNG